MTKSLLITSLFPPGGGGVQRVLYNIANQLPPDQVIVLAPLQGRDKDFDAQCQFRIYRQKQGGFIYNNTKRFLSPTLARTIIYFPTAFSLVRRENISIIQCGFLQVGLVAYLLKKLSGKPYVIYVHGVEIIPPTPRKCRSIFDRLLRLRSRYGIALKKMVLQSSDIIIVYSEYNKQRIIQHFQIEKRKILKMPVGADLANLISPPQTDEIIHNLSLQDKKVVLTVARLVDLKGHDAVIKALPNVLKHIPNAVYLIIGRGPAENRLRELVNALKLQAHVVFLGHIPHKMLPPYYHLCDLFIMPSKSESGEGFGLVYLEANAWRKPVIGGHSGGIPDAVLDGVTGLLVDPANVTEIAEAIIQILSNPDYAQYLGTNGQRRVETEMNWQQTGIRVRQILTAIVEGSHIQ